MKKTLTVILALFMLFSFAGCEATNTVEVIKCYRCGETNASDAIFCAYCGRAFVEQDENDEADTALPDNPSDPDEKEDSESTVHEGETEPAEDLYVMKNTGADSIYFGNSICVDGEVIYLSYYGNLYMFCGDEVAVYSGGGTNTNTIAEMYLYNGYVYYANLNNYTIYRMSVADGSRDIVLTGIGEIQDTFMRGQFLYVFTKAADENYGIYSLNLETREKKLLLQQAEDAYQLKQIDQVDKDYVLFIEILQNQVELILLNAKDNTVSEGYCFETVSRVVASWKRNDETGLYLCLRSWNENEEFKYIYPKVNKQTHTVEEGTESEYDAAADLPFDDGLEWKYYLATLQKNLCREHKETGVQELLVKAGTGNREDGETVAKTYNIREILYADDTRVIFKRYRMADGLEESVWQVDSDGNNLTELIRKEYHANAPDPYPVGSPSSSGSTSSSGSNGSAVGAKTCALCQGDGRITCYYCKGSGKGTTIYVMGIPTEQGCSYCGSAGWRVCSGCGGYGVK